jgi:hypothetical protein
MWFDRWEQLWNWWPDLLPVRHEFAEFQISFSDWANDTPLLYLAIPISLVVYYVGKGLVLF